MNSGGTIVALDTHTFFSIEEPREAIVTQFKKFRLAASKASISSEVTRLELEDVARSEGSRVSKGEGHDAASNVSFRNL